MTTQNKVAIVTGASAGIGKAIALELNQQGYTVYGGARRVEQMADLVQQGIHVHQLDVTDQASNQALIKDILSEAGSIDLLINSAGYGSQGALEDVTPEEAKRQFDVNVFGLMNLTQLVLPTMRVQHAGKVINISSTGGQGYMPLGGWYYASKHALEAMSDTLRLEVKPFGIDVIIIEPGGTKTEWGNIALENLKKQTPDDSAYKAMVDGYAGVNVDGVSVTPDVIAKLVMRSINARHPKTRYQPTFGTKMFVIAARKLSYRAFDWLVNRTMSAVIKPKAK